MTNHNITPELIRAALQHIPANLSRDEWARVGMAIKSEFPDDTGRDLFTTWSASGDSFNAKNVADTWRSIKAGGGVGIGTLLHLAKENGFSLPQANQAPSKPDPATSARLARERAASQQAEQAKQQAAHEAAALEAGRLWDISSEMPTSEINYPSRKGVPSFGLRFEADNTALVPMRDASGKLWNVQRIAPNKPASGPDKLFLKGGRKSGLWHMCGDPAGAAAILVCEGAATGASLFEATGRPVAIAFDAGNLGKVAKALHQAHSAALIVVCGDDDRDTEARNGTNTGKLKATAAALAVHGLAVFPENLSEGGSDFNDLHQAAGVEAVRLIIDSAIDSHEPHQTKPLSTKPTTAGKRSQSASRERTGPQNEASGGNVVDRFTVDDSGVWFNGVDQHGNEKPPAWICSALHVEALTRDQEGGGWGYLLVFDDPLGNAKQWAMPARMLSADGAEYRSTLLNMGLRIATTPYARNMLTQFIQTRKPEEFASCTDRIGWHGRAYVLPRETIGDDAERIVYQSDSAMENTFRIKGTAEQWRDRVGVLCAGNSRLLFGVACAFAAPLLRPAGMESGGFHVHGDSSSGKSTLQNIAASVYGGPSFKRSFRQTDNAIEGVAAQHNDCLLILDEISQVEPRVIGEVVYMLGNGEGKTRATRTAVPRPPLRWKLIFLCTGENKLSDIMADAQKRTNAGQETRLAHIPADAGAGLGVFENLHGYEGGAAFAKHITHQAEAVYGAPGRAWLQWCTTHADTLKAATRKAAATLAASMMPKDCAGQVERVGARFALVGAAGEMATAAGLTGWPAGESEQAARACFNAWIAARGGIGNGEVVAMLRAVRRFLETHGEGRFALWHRQGDDHNSKTLQRAGFRRVYCADGDPFKDIGASDKGLEPSFSYVLDQGGSVHYFVLPECFRTEICNGFDYKAVARVLLDAGCLLPGKDRAFDSKHRLPGMGKNPVNCYQITPAIFALDL
ncbi:MAG: DUF927 domain-containing protein [Rhodoferax sp.]|nr:DUF927 domain-containing protein [Rhodoferax sp.]MBP9059968.1 DUF927 domain-containing protein [Rhodoferax sp.]